MVLVKNWPFPQLFFLGKIGREHLFGNVLDIIIAPLDHKNINMGVSPWIWSKIGHFFNVFFLGKIGREKLFNDLLDRIIAFLDNKTNNIKR